MEEAKVQVIDSKNGIDVFEAQERAAIDTQVATAKAYPRDLRKVTENSVVIATMNKETAESCRYAKPVAGKSITGASVHLARIIAQQYGNIRVDQRIKNIDNKTITAEAVAYDMETNYAVRVEARRSIIGKTGNRFSESVIETNAMALLAIAERNAILKVVPKAITDTVYREAFNMAHGELSDSAKLMKAKDSILKTFKNDYGCTEEETLGFVGLKAKGALNAEAIVDLRGFIQAIKDKELTIEDLKNRGVKSKPTTPADKKASLQEKKQGDNPVSKMA